MFGGAPLGAVALAGVIATAAAVEPASTNWGHADFPPRRHAYQLACTVQVTPLSALKLKAGRARVEAIQNFTLIELVELIELLEQQ